MKAKFTAPRMALLAAAISLASYSATGIAAQASSHHDHGSGESQQALKLDNGSKWATDPALRRSMARIRASLAQRLDAAHADRLTPAQYRAVAGEISEQVAYVVRNCKLEPAADAVLHVVIADLLAAADAMNGKTPGTLPRSGFVRALDALDDYAKHFEHPSWVALKH